MEIPINARPPSVPPMIAAVGVFAPSPAGDAVIRADVEDDIPDAGNVDVGANVMGESGGITRK